MSVKLSVPTHLLSQPEIAQAVQRLILVLGGRTEPQERPVPTTQSAPVRVVAPEPVATRPAAALAPPTTNQQPVMSLAEFIESLPDNSKRFLAVVHGLKVVKVNEMVRRLGVKNAKAVGGITGAIGRWGPARGVTLPYERFILDGERAWRWIGPTTGLRLPPVPDVQDAPPALPILPPEPVAPAEPTVVGLLSQVSPAARRFAKALQSQSVLSVTAAAEAAQVQGMGALRTLAAELNAVAKPFDQRLVRDDLDVKGNITYCWQGLQDKPAPKPAETLMSTADAVADKPKQGGLIRRRRRT